VQILEAFVRKIFRAEAFFISMVRDGFGMQKSAENGFE